MFLGPQEQSLGLGNSELGIAVGGGGRPPRTSARGHARRRTPRRAGRSATRRRRRARGRQARGSTPPRRAAAGPRPRTRRARRPRPRTCGQGRPNPETCGPRITLHRRMPYDKSRAAPMSGPRLTPRKFGASPIRSPATDSASRTRRNARAAGPPSEPPAKSASRGPRPSRVGCSATGSCASTRSWSLAGAPRPTVRCPTGKTQSEPASVAASPIVVRCSRSESALACQLNAQMPSAPAASWRAATPRLISRLRSGASSGPTNASYLRAAT
jgi:hypothetical protein